MSYGKAKNNVGGDGRDRDEDSETLVGGVKLYACKAKKLKNCSNRFVMLYMTKSEARRARADFEDTIGIQVTGVALSETIKQAKWGYRPDSENTSHYCCTESLEGFTSG
ncbi:unnamed protein product [Enterobius vermicularis]|uniref:RRM domain-containing protein n=1 Tax=Enterobius vermicularis TaxID=51028 RepID=A0A0N4VHY5_ENTVE|nr:unnamed protein product [Enterobius vermicularis]